MKGFFLTLFIWSTIAHCWAQENEPELYLGWNHLFEIGLDLNQLIKINPRIGEEGSSLRYGGSVQMRNILVGQNFEFSNRLYLLLGGMRNENEAFFDSLSQLVVNPLKKNYDRVEWQLTFARELRPDKDYLTAEMYSITQLAPSYDGNFYRQVFPEARKLSAFISPMISTASVGLERRKGKLYSIYYSPVSFKWITIGDEEIAGIPALNFHQDSVEFFGSGIHGNDLEYNIDSLEVVSFKKNKFFFGSQLLFKYEQHLFDDILELVNESRLFLDYLHKPLELDLQINFQINFLLLKGLKIGFEMDLLRDNNLIFQSSEPRSTSQISSTKFTQGTSYMHRLMLKYTFQK